MWLSVLIEAPETTPTRQQTDGEGIPPVFQGWDDGNGLFPREDQQETRPGEGPGEPSADEPELDVPSLSDVDIPFTQGSQGLGAGRADILDRRRARANIPSGIPGRDNSPTKRQQYRRSLRYGK
ncbi:hypothetical protein ACOMHN_060348 [Nucella lapillus]